MLKSQYQAATLAVITDTSPRAAPKLEGYAREMRALALRMAALPAPAALKEGRDRVAAFMTAVSKDLDNLARAAARDDQTTATAATQNVNGHSQGLTKAQGELMAAIAESSQGG